MKRGSTVHISGSNIVTTVGVVKIVTDSVLIVEHAPACSLTLTRDCVTDGWKFNRMPVEVVEESPLDLVAFRSRLYAALETLRAAQEIPMMTRRRK